MPLKFLTVVAVAFIALTILRTHALNIEDNSDAKITWWKFQAIDTMKYSRDLAREKLTDDSFDAIIDSQVKAIADTGATHIAIATPYDDEFVPFLSRWVTAARKNNLKVWFRGNFSGWEGWFDYEKITREQHIEKTKLFITNNRTLFSDGDIFTACPECENGGPGDPRQTGDVSGFRKFLTDEYSVSQTAFFKLNLGILTNFNSMNGDVAKLIMDKKTTQSLGGIVTIDHYVKTPKQLAKDIELLAEQSGGKIVLGEFGAPIPDIHGKMTEEEQAAWLSETLELLSVMPQIYGINYWTHTGSSTQLWKESGTPYKAVEVLTKYYSPKTLEIYVKDETKKNISDATITLGNSVFRNGANGAITIPYIKPENLITIQAATYLPQETSIERLLDKNEIILLREKEGLLFNIRKYIINLLLRLNLIK